MVEKHHMELAEANEIEGVPAAEKLVSGPFNSL